MEVTQDQIKNPRYFVPIGEAQAAKKKLEADILVLLNEFHQSTGLPVKLIAGPYDLAVVGSNLRGDRRPVYEVRIEVTL